MPKAKSKKFHKIKIHPNRWLIWAIAYALIVTIGILGYIQVTEINFENYYPAQTVFKPSRTFTSTKLGFSVRYPVDWSIDQGSKNSVDFLPMDATSEGITIGSYSLSTEKQIRSSMTIVSEIPTRVDGVAGREIVNNLGHRALETVVLVKHNNKLFYFAGPPAVVHNFVQDFSFIN